MTLQNESFSVEVTKLSGVEFSAEKEGTYDFFKEVEEIENPDLVGVLKIQVNNTEKNYTFALVGCYLSNEDAVVLNGDILTVLQDDMITQIDLSKGEIVRSIRFDLTGTGDGLFEVEGGFIVRGESEIVKLDTDLKVIWRFSGRDIFYLPSGENAFEMCENSIKLRDFLGYHYEIDYDGKLIFEFPPAEDEVAAQIAEKYDSESLLDKKRGV